MIQHLFNMVRPVSVIGNVALKHVRTATTPSEVIIEFIVKIDAFCGVFDHEVIFASYFQLCLCHLNGVFELQFLFLYFKTFNMEKYPKIEYLLFFSDFRN